MTGISELRLLPVVDRLKLVEDLWNSIVDDQDSVPEHAAVVAEVRARKARFLADPASGKPWEEAKACIRSGHA